jgi:hypothetical protein
MASWNDVVAAEPDFAARVRARFDAHRHKTIATVRADGSPRISGIEAEFTTGELEFGSMPDARKAIDLTRDPRFALHSGSDDPPEDPTTWTGDAKVAGRAVLAGNQEESGGVTFRADLTEVVLTTINEAGDRLVIELWVPGGPLRRFERE